MRPGDGGRVLGIAADDDCAADEQRVLVGQSDEANVVRRPLSGRARQGFPLPPLQARAKA